MSKIFSFSFLLVTAFSLHAQTTDSSKTAILDEVVVTANKLPQKQNATGKIVSVITREQLEKSTGHTLPQLLNEQAGITINGALNNIGYNQTVYMRGASSGRTLVLVDGIPVSDPSFIQNDFDINLVSLNSVERIEISRGAQSTLYGSDAIAGVINIITIKKDVTKPVNLKATIAGGNYGTFRGNIQLYGKANKLSYSARYAKLLTNGFSSAYDSTGKGDFDNDGYNGDVTSASVQYQATENFLVRTFLQHSHYKTDLDAGLFTDENDYTASSKILMSGAGIHYKKSIVSVTGNYQYSENKRNYRNDSLDVPGFSQFMQDDYNGQAHFLELYSSIEVSKNLTLLQGADYRFNKMDSRLFSLSSWGPFSDTFHANTQSQSSLYASLFFKDNSEKLHVELGGRLNVHSAYGSNQTFTFNPSFRITNSFRLFGSIATGFKAPTLYQLYSFSYGVEDLKPERSTTYEFGLQHQRSKINTRIVYFYRDISNGIDFNNFDFKYYNFTRQKVHGAELEAKWQATDELVVSANYTYLHPEEYSQSRYSFTDTTYKHLLRRPDHVANVSAGYRFKNGFYISLSGRYTGTRYDAGGYMANDILLDSYFLLNAYAEFKRNEKWTIFLDAQNLTNSKFFDTRGCNAIPLLLNGGVTFNW